MVTLRQAAESFGVDAQRYDRTRPPYPDALIERVIAGSPGRDVLDVGCGTGIAARQFQTVGCTVLGVEPDERMAGFATASGVPVDVSRFEDWAPDGRTFDTVIAATAWHWIDPSAGPVKAATILRPRGRLALFWHTYELPTEIAEAFATVYKRVIPDAPFTITATSQGPDAYQPMFTKAADGIRAVDDFGEPEQWRFDWQRSYTKDAWLDQLPTSGALTRLPPEPLARVLAEVGAAIDAVGGELMVRYATVAVTAYRR